MGTERYTAPGGKLGLKRNTSLGEDLKDIVKGVARMVSPTPVKDRSLTVDAAVDNAVDRQHNDRNNSY